MSAPSAPEPPAKLEQKKYVVAFLDFLGASEKMRSPEESDKFLQQVNRIFNEILGLRDFENNNKFIQIEDIKIKIFSDNIVIARECGCGNGSMECFTISKFCARLQGYALHYGLLLRGAITMGNFYIDERFVYGEALVRAYDLESTVAIYPRIIMAGEVADVTALQAYKGDPNKWIVPDSDGKWMVNFVSQYTSGVDKKIAIQLIAAARRKILDLFLPRPALIPIKIRQKYHWLAVKFNELCEMSGFRAQQIVFTPMLEPDIAYFYEDEY